MHSAAHPPAGIHGILSVLADVADTGRSADQRSRIPDPLRWIDLGDVTLMASFVPSAHLPDPFPPGQEYATLAPFAFRDREVLGRFAAIDAIRPGQRSLRLGWLWVTGTVEDEDGQARRIFEPLVIQQVGIPRRSLLAGAEPELTPLITDHDQRLLLEARLLQAFGEGGFDGLPAAAPPALLARMPQLRSFATQAAAAAGLAATELVPATGSPAATVGGEALRIVVGLGLYAVDTEIDFSPAGSLRIWHDRIGTQWTALHALYLDRPAPVVPPQEDVPSAYRLTVTQHACVVEARTAPVTVISGAPGTGKTHTIAAIIGDAVARGLSVLVAATSEAAVDAILELVADHPGPDPVVFGARGRRTALARRLAAGEPVPAPAAEVDRRHDAMRRAVADRDLLWRTAAESLEGLVLLGDGSRAQALRQRLPGLSRPQVDLFEVQRLARRVGTTPPAVWRLGARRHWNQLCDLLGVDGTPDPVDLRQAISLATAARTMHQAADPLTDNLTWSALVEAQERVEQTTGEWMDAAARDERRLTRGVRASRAALATALRAGRSKRRTLLAELGPEIPRSLPVWIGTLGDIDDLLPMAPAMFDLVILDEASAVDQSRAATALLRAERCVVVGDPQQLRHVSFVADRSVVEAVDRHVPSASPALTARLQVRQNSLFDVAAGVAPIRRLDEHFRSAAHLFDFVGSRIYGDTVQVATLTPATDHVDCVTVHRMDAERTAARVVQEEVDWVMRRLEQLRAEGADSVGVISPFRAQADAIEAAALEAFDEDAIRSLGLRVGTVHAFQGMERDVVIVSLGVGRDDGGNTWRFAGDPNLFAVMATRARQHMEWLVSASPPAGSLVEQYLQAEDRPPNPERGVGPDAGPWARRVAGHLDELVVAAPYRSGRHQLDLCLADGSHHLGVETQVHPEGVDDHIRRHVELARNGWPLVTALRAQWADRPAELALRLRQALATG